LRCSLVPPYSTLAHHSMKRFLNTALLVLGMLFFGTINTVFFKLMFQIHCPTLPSGFHVYDKPWLTNLMMFSAEASLLVVFYASRPRSRGLAIDTSDAKLTVDTRPQAPPAYYFLIPASCDVLGTGISSMSMMLINAAVWQMMRGSIILFSAIMAVIFLKRKLQAYHWIGVGTTVVGLCLIATASILENTSETVQVPGAAPSQVGLGVSLVVVAQVFAAFQCTFEEHLLTGHQVSATQTVGMEGAWGCALMVVVLSVMTMLPGSDHGSYESLPDGAHMIVGSKFFQGITSSYMLSIACYNYVGMTLCRKLSAVTRCLVDCLRISVVWTVELCLYYGVSSRYGNPWTSYSPLQLVGFILLFVGTLIYNDLLKIPGMSKAPSEMPRRALEATWSPTVNRAAKWGRGSLTQGPQSPGASPAGSPLAWPFGRSLSPGQDPRQVPLLPGEIGEGEVDLMMEEVYEEVSDGTASPTRSISP